MDKKIRVRFAPSPTGPLHIGGVRTALYNYLFAKKHGGDMILRIEDTDSNRFVPGAEKYIEESLAWLGIKFDEGVNFGGNYGPYKQSERKEIYRKYIEQLLDNGLAYIAFDTPEELDAKREAVSNFQYDASTRLEMKNSLTLTPAEVEQKIKNGDVYVVRMKISPNEEVKVNDLIRGEVVINSSILDDKVLWKSADGLPTYHLANIVDDHLMEITHVIRGEEWLPSAPLHVLLYRAFGWTETMPQFAHLPLLLKPEGNGKLSKRDGDRLGFPVFPLEWKDPKTGDISSGYREAGYFPEAVVNFLALLGWNPGTEQEIFSMDELIQVFSLDRVSKSGAKFDYEKGKWFNHQYLIKKSDEELATLFNDVLSRHCGTESSSAFPPLGFAAWLCQESPEKLEKIVNIVKERVSFVKDLWNETFFFFIAPDSYDEKAVQKRWKEETPAQLTELINILTNSDFSSAEQLEETVKTWINEKAYNIGGVMNPLRLSLVGELKGPHVFDILAILGKEESIKRIQKAIDTI
jgi:glutamyl-tRNA synthetase